MLAHPCSSWLGACTYAPFHLWPPLLLGAAAPLPIVNLEAQQRLRPSLILKSGLIPRSRHELRVRQKRALTQEQCPWNLV